MIFILTGKANTKSWAVFWKPNVHTNVFPNSENQGDQNSSIFQTHVKIMIYWTANLNLQLETMYMLGIKTFNKISSTGHRFSHIFQNTRSSMVILLWGFESWEGEAAFWSRLLILSSVSGLIIHFSSSWSTERTAIGPNFLTLKKKVKP